MYLLAEVNPGIRRFRLFLARDQWILLLAAFNEIILGLDTYLAHSITGQLKIGEWIPVIFGPVSGALLILAGLIALHRRTQANLIASGVFVASMVVGILGSYFHLHRALLPEAPAGQQITSALLVYGPPLLGPLTFVLIGILGISAAWAEVGGDTGVVRLVGGMMVRMPMSKTRAYFLMTALFILVTLISSVLDHAQTAFKNPWLWLPTFTGIFAVFVTTAMGAYAKLNKNDLITYLAAMGLMGLVGMTGAILHVVHNITGQGNLIGERFIHGAPLLAPLLFANMALLGLTVLLDPKPQGDPA